ncbi:AfsR/SARP family transcriptional regulator [Nonomuraea pusilla]|uniref:DNA-binding transcriptional activator of the SARP family n=1 Tax=Nonomuraea pusilla TaxID=46177 RepID=A0A1H7J4D7_9ACTN|nr:BTAD domain-containing putative transcriptional regulator [Nonomuraea pusilla]SEK69254.1 DNA-binding transcriptional activator of the SARP family [Nonomuraea pusilla]
MQFAVLGPLTVVSGGTALPLGSAKQRTLLAALLGHANTAVPARRLTEALWEDPPASAPENLRLYIHRLRRVLAEPGRIVRHGSGYLMVVRPGELDADRFGELAGEGVLAREAGDLNRARDLLGRALALWRGAAYGELAHTPLIREAAARLEEDRLRVTEERVGVDLEQGRHAELPAELKGLVRAHPYRESLRGLLMLALYGCGRQSEALDVFMETRALLGEQLGIEPGPRLRRLHEAILRADEDLLLPLLLPGREPATPVPRELPAPPPGFTGRADALKTLDETLDEALDETPRGDGRRGVVTVVAGPAGVGKTALAVHWGHRVAERFPGGQLYLDLHGYSPELPLSPARALTTLLGALGTPPERIPADVAQAAARYRSLVAGRRMLVVLDNAASAEQVRPLLPGAPGCLALVTSRDRLSGLVAQDGARRITLGLLTPAEAGELLGAVLGEPRVAAEPEAAAALTASCGRLPLALRIAAAHLLDRPLRPIADYADELSRGDPLARLEIEDDPGTAVRAALDLSYAALAAGERRMFRLLGIAPGVDVTAEGAAATAGLSRDRAERLLDRLAARHLLEERAPGRYAFHDLVRLHARATAHAEDGPGEREAAVERTYDWYLSAVDSAAELLYRHMVRLPPPRTSTMRFGGAGDARAWLDAESANLVAAAVEAAGAGRQEAWHLALALRGYFWMTGDTDAAVTVATAALTAARSARDLRGEAAARLALGQMLTRFGRFGEALGHLTEVVALTGRVEWPRCRASAFVALGTLHAEQGRLPQAAEHYRRSLELSRRCDDPAGQAVSLANLAYVASHAGDLEQAVAYGERVLARYRMDGSPDGEAAVLTDLGHVYHLLGRFGEALGRLERALALYRRHGPSVEEPVVLAALADVHGDLGRHERALELAEAAVHAARDDEGRARATAMAALGTAHRRLGRLPSALHHLDRALAVPEVTRHRLLETRIRLDRAATRLAAGDTAGTVADAEHALAIARAAGYRLWEGRALRLLAEATAGTRRSANPP